MSTSVRRIVAVISGLVLFVAGAATSAALRQDASSAERAPVQLPAFQRAVFLSHVNDPATTPLFPGDPAFSIRTVFTVPDDGFYLELVREGAHTGTHYSAPCHFHDGALCMDGLSPSDLVLPAVVVGSFTWLRNTARWNAGSWTGARSALEASCRNAADVAAPATNRTSPEITATILRTDVDIAPLLLARRRSPVCGR